MNVLIITEGSSKIGFGHVTRCMSLYQAFSEKEFSVKFVVNGDSTIESLLNGTEHEIFNWLENSDRLFNLLNKLDIVIIDSYLADEYFYEKMSQLTGLSVYIDDNKRIDYPKGIVINGSILADKLNYPLKNEIDYVLGSQYIPLRREFWSIDEKRINETLQTVMITFGGDDLRNLTPELLKRLKKYYPDLKKKVVIGKGFKKIDEIENSTDDKTELIYYPDAEGMLEAMLESDVAISAGGQTLYELARVGLPTIAIGVACNQVHNVENWEKLGFIEFAGFWKDKNLYRSVLEKLDLLKDQKIRIKKSKIGIDSVDGQGAIKIVKYSLKKYYSNKVKLRTANLKDIYNVYELSNDDEVRQNSFNKDKITFENHEIWFKEKINDSSTLFLVVELGNDFAGQVRFDLDDNSATISISIAHVFRDLGLGNVIIEKSIEYLKLNIPKVKIIKAYIKESNERSLNLFEKMGFKNKRNVLMKNQNALECTYKIGD